MQTSGIINEIICFEMPNKYCKLLYESPVARNLSVTAHLTVTEIAGRIFVSCLIIFGPMRLKIFSKSAVSSAKSYS